MTNRRWSDLGYIPDEYREWFLENSGTYYDEEKDEWFTDKGKLIRGATGEYKEPYYLADKFEGEFKVAKEMITEKLPGTKIKYGWIWELMIKGYVDIDDISVFI